MMVLLLVMVAVHSELGTQLSDRARLEAVDCVDQRGPADGALHRLLSLLLPGIEEQEEVAALSVDIE